MRAMSKGDLAFFYHSNCKVPGIVGVMEIVEEHTVDGQQIIQFYAGTNLLFLTIITHHSKLTYHGFLESAYDSANPYFDPKSTRDAPKWCVVHVEFRQKFPRMITLKELQKFAKPGAVLEGMQTLKQSRLSVSKVSKEEYDFIMSLVENDES